MHLHARLLVRVRLHVHVHVRLLVRVRLHVRVRVHVLVLVLVLVLVRVRVRVRVRAPRKGALFRAFEEQRAHDHLSNETTTMAPSPNTSFEDAFTWAVQASLDNRHKPTRRRLTLTTSRAAWNLAE